MATNTEVDQRSTVVHEEEGVALDASGEATVTVPDLRSVGSPEQVDVTAYGTGDATSGEGRLAVCTAVGTDSNGVTTVTVHSYIGGGADTSFNDDASATLDHVQIRATGL